MNRGPVKGARPEARSFFEKVREAYGDPAPDWLIELAALADEIGLSGCEKRISYSRSAISNVLNGKYDKGDMGRVEAMVRGALMGKTVECPVLGGIGRDRCLQEQNEPFRATSAFRAQLYHACRGGCPHARSKDGGRDAE
jgi:hypothetical protein